MELAVTEGQAEKIGQLAADRSKYKRASRRKSRDESAFAGRAPGVRKVPQASANRTHSKTTTLRGTASKPSAIGIYSQGTAGTQNAASLKLQ